MINTRRRKRLGQYFTGVGLGRLLAALAQAEKAKTILDPMAGSGDLLASCLQVGAQPKLLAGIEIDPAVRDACAARISEAHCLLGSAFDPEILSKLPAKEWDLVIANPPYVRYQTFSDKADAVNALPSAMQVRSDLAKALQLMPALDGDDKRMFTRMVSGYSGLSDLAVPSWILCAGLVKRGGRLALVVPESWLSRDYATIVHYLLLRWFDLEFVVEDEHASWFEDAQVKTTLIVARRVKRRTSALSRPEVEAYCHIGISAAAASAESPIGRLALPGTGLEKSFAKHARQWLRQGSNHVAELTKARPVSIRQTCRNVVTAASRQKWFAALGEAKGDASDGVFMPHEIHEWLTRRGLAPAFENFECQGVAVGQGLRTGANAFFYAAGRRRGSHVDLAFTGPLSGLCATAPLGIARPVLRRQVELPDSFVVSPRIAKGWALDLRDRPLPEDMAPGEISAAHKLMPEDVAKVVRAAARANFGTADKFRKIWELSAVAPNVRPASRGTLARHWYMLPDFAQRHLPDLLLARVNSNTPRAYLNERRLCLIDANFSTMWVTGNSRWEATGLLAFMNSSWAQAVIERSGAVMGGGALKVEAAHLRRCPVPVFDASQRQQLAELGSRLAAGEHVETTIAAIDALVTRVLGCEDETGGSNELRGIAREARERRAKHNGKRRGSDGDELR